MSVQEVLDKRIHCRLEHLNTTIVSVQGTQKESSVSAGSYLNTTIVSVQAGTVVVRMSDYTYLNTTIVSVQEYQNWKSLLLWNI